MRVNQRPVDRVAHRRDSAFTTFIRDGLCAYVLGLFLLSSCSPSITPSDRPEVETQTGPPAGEAHPVEFKRGSATIELSDAPGVVARLNQLDDSTFLPRFDPEFGAQSEWTDDQNEWLLTVIASGVEGADVRPRIQLWLERFDVDPPLYAVGSGCATTLTSTSAVGFVGSAVCTNMRWLDGYVADSDPSRAMPLPGYPPFDARINFEARP